MKLSKDEKKEVIAALTIAKAKAEQHNLTVAAWTYANLRKKFEQALVNSE